MNIQETDPQLAEVTQRWLNESLRGGYPRYVCEGLAGLGIVPIRPLSLRIRSQLEAIGTSGYPFPESPFFAAQTELEGGHRLPTVLFVSDITYFCHCGIDNHRPFVRLKEIRGVDTSPHQMPLHVAREILSFGESGMGYVTFELLMRDGARIPCWYGNVAEFVQLPPPYSASDIIRAVPTDRQPNRHTDLVPPKSMWCVYREGESVIRRLAPNITSKLKDVDKYLELRPEASD